ncbi:MAG: patatin family protein [Alphaproteobacteria bacterium]|nr:patatin family protein [Alphaproteobacteria bacterium]
MASALILEGGAKRGIYTAGVLDVLVESGVEVDAVFGVSAGAIHGVSYISKQIGRSLRYNLDYNDDYRFMSFRNWLLTGNVVDVKFCYDELPNRLDVFDYETFAAGKTKFFAVCSNVETGQAEYIHCPEMHKGIEYVRASASLPFLSRIVKIGDKKLLDGGICDSIPLQAAEKRGYDKNIVVLTRPAGYRKPRAHNHWLAKLVYSAYPRFVRAITDRHLMYNAELDYVNQREKDGDILVIRPSKTINIGKMEKNPEVIKAMYNLGRQDAEAIKAKIHRFLA